MNRKNTAASDKLIKAVYGSYVYDVTFTFTHCQVLVALGLMTKSLNISDLTRASHINHRIKVLVYLILMMGFII